MLILIPLKVSRIIKFYLCLCNGLVKYNKAIEFAKNKFHIYRIDLKKSINPTLYRYILPVVTQNCTKEDLDFLINQYTRSKSANEKITILTGLGNINKNNNPEYIINYAITNIEVHVQQYIMESLTENCDICEMIWDIFILNFKNLMIRYNSNVHFARLLHIIGKKIYEQNKYTQLKDLIKKHKICEKYFVIKQMYEQIELNIKIQQNITFFD